MFTPPSKVKKSKNQEANTPRQSSITRYFTPNRPELRSGATTPAPLMAYRHNSATKSPLPPEMDSSEYSADGEEGRRTRRSARHLKSDSQVGELVHNDLVSVDGTAGRVIDPACAMLEDRLPPQLVSECRSGRREKNVCVMLFGTENKWGWYPVSEVKALDLSGANENVSASSHRLAKLWMKKTVDQSR